MILSMQNSKSTATMVGDNMVKALLNTSKLKCLQTKSLNLAADPQKIDKNYGHYHSTT